jgi:hypothetical protein
LSVRRHDHRFNDGLRPSSWQNERCESAADRDDFDDTPAIEILFHQTPPRFSNGSPINEANVSIADRAD